MRVDISTVLPCTFDEAVAQVKTPRLLRFIAHPLVQFTPLQPTTFPEAWSEGTYWVRLTLFGLLPFGKQAVVISFPPSQCGFVIRDAGYSALIKTWDHRITITSEPGGTHYRDEVRVSAGALTPIIWLFAQVFYRHRQRRWHKLARTWFNHSGD